MSNQTAMSGAFSAYSSKISKDSQSNFNEALEGLIGVTYTPVAVSQQVVAGINYHFFCNTEVATRRPSLGAAIVSIYKPLEGKATVTNIKEIN